MTEESLIGLSAIIILGIFGQWISWYLKIPSILLLLVFGLLVGPATGLLDPDQFFGDLLFPLVSIAVAIILFEGGLSLKIHELGSVFGIVRNLITVGTVITWFLASLSAYYLIGISISLSLLLGAILVVTGPTVIIPLLRIVKPKGQINSILKWEGIVNDPIGALLALLVFDTIISAGPTEATVTVLLALFKTLVISSLIGLAGAYFLVSLIKEDYIPDYLQNPATLASVMLIFALSNTIQSESGLFAVTLMGIYLANQKHVVIEHIIEFKENLGILLLSTLFIVLAARLKLSDLQLIDTGVLIFISVLIILVRPVSIFISTFGSNINWREKIYLSWMAPRGIVAAAVTSIFAIELIHKGYEEANILVPVMFLAIIATILVYGLSAIPLARLLKLSDPDPQGILIAGINKLSIEIHQILENFEIKVLLIDTNWEKVTGARQQGINAYFGSVVSEKTLENINLEGIGKFLSLTSNKGINSLSTIYYSKVFESSNVYQINTAPKHNQDLLKELRGHFFSSESLTYPALEEADYQFQVKANKITEEFNLESLIVKHGQSHYHPLFIIIENKKLIVYSDKNSVAPEIGDTLISLIFE